MTIESSEAEVRTLFPEVDEIADETLRRSVIDIWLEVGKECAWSRFEDIPKNAETEKDRRLTDHTRAVTRMALSLAEIAERDHGTKYNRDYLLAACLLHDVSKALESEPDLNARPTNGPVLPGKKSEFGVKIQHGVYGTHKAFQHGLPLDVAHLILTHTHASNLRSKSIEACFLFYADMADTDVGLLSADGVPFMTRFKLH